MMLDELMDHWRAGGLEPHAHEVGDGTLVTVARGARAVPFDDAGRPLLWLAPEGVPPVRDVGADPVATPSLPAGPSLSTWVASDAWNLGAERLWIGPEIDFMVADRRDFAGSYALPVAMDPGSWRVESGAPGASGASGEPGAPGAGLPITFRHAMNLFAHQQHAPLRIDVTQTLTPLPDPAAAAGLPLAHLGWSREVTVTRTADDPRRVACQAWVLIQADIGATVVVPEAGSARVTDYFEPVDPDHLRRVGDDLALRLSGTTRYKVGVRSGEHRGEVAYWRDLPDGRALLLLRRFADTPSTRYLEQPPELPAHEGDSVYVYNDDGRYGAFGEVEVLGRALEPDMDSVTDAFDLHAWWGEREAVAVAATSLGLQLPRMLFI